MAHAFTRRCGNTGDEAGNRFLDFGSLQEFTCFFLGRAADFTDHDDAFGFRILQEQVEAVDEVGAVDRVTTDTEATSLAALAMLDKESVLATNRLIWNVSLAVLRGADRLVEREAARHGRAEASAAAAGDW